MLKPMGVVISANIQTVEEIYELIRTAVTTHQPVSAMYDGRLRLLCPHRLGQNGAGQNRVLCYQYGGGSSSGLGEPDSPDNWRCMNVEKFSKVAIIEGIWRTAPNHSRPQTCVTQVDVDAEDPHA